MTDKKKKTILFVIILGSFFIYSLIYYAHVFNNAPYNFKEFKSFIIRYGTRDKMVNYYSSTTGEYDYLNKSDSLVKMHLQLTKADLDSLHTYARNLGFWDFPSQELSADTTSDASKNIPRYNIQFNYKRKSKHVVFDANYQGPSKLVDANKDMIKKITDVLSNAQERQAKTSNF
jgi:hypothetical protein